METKVSVTNFLEDELELSASLPQTLSVLPYFCWIMPQYLKCVIQDPALLWGKVHKGWGQCWVPVMTLFTQAALDKLTFLSLFPLLQILRKIAPPRVALKIKEGMQSGTESNAWYPINGSFYRSLLHPSTHNSLNTTRALVFRLLHSFYRSRCLECACTLLSPPSLCFESSH